MPAAQRVLRQIWIGSLTREELIYAYEDELQEHCVTKADLKSADEAADDLRTQLSEAQQKLRETDRLRRIVTGHYQDEQDRLREAYQLLAQEWNVDVDSVAFDEAYDSARDRWLQSENDE